MALARRPDLPMQVRPAQEVDPELENLGKKLKDIDNLEGDILDDLHMRIKQKSVDMNKQLAKKNAEYREKAQLLDDIRDRTRRGPPRILHLGRAPSNCMTCVLPVRARRPAATLLATERGAAARSGGREVGVSLHVRATDLGWAMRVA